MTEAHNRRASAPSGQATRSPTTSSFPITWRTASCGSRSRESTTAFTRSTTSAPAPSEPCPLSGGLLTGTTLMCQCHGSRFDITTGAVINGPATEALHVYEVQEVDGDIQIRA